MSATRRDHPYIWVTWITGLLAGDLHCEWQAWFRANHQGYDKIQRDSQLTVWKAQHGEMVRARAEALTSEGYRVFVENQNKFAMRGAAATLGGVPDLVAVRDGGALVIDCKTGQQKDGDLFQVLLYMLVLPRTHSACDGLAVSGELQYKSTSVLVPSSRLTDTVKNMIRTTIERVAGNTPLPRVPSFGDCRFCDIGSDCDQRVSEDRALVSAEGLF